MHLQVILVRLICIFVFAHDNQ